jgi:alkylhydroperoxidase family enzyme
VSGPSAGAAFTTWLPVTAGTDPFSLLTAGGPQLRHLFDGIYEGELDPVTVELCRLRIATLVGCEVQRELRDPRAVAAGLDDGLVADLPRWPSAARITEAQRQALRFAEQFVLDPRGFTDDDTIALEQHFTPAQLASLTIAVAAFDALARVGALLTVDPTRTASPTVAARASVPTDH